MKDFMASFNISSDCTNCLPDCQSVILTSKVSTVPIREWVTLSSNIAVFIFVNSRCDFLNIGSSKLCKIPWKVSKTNPEALDTFPALWANTVRKGSNNIHMKSFNFLKGQILFFINVWILKREDNNWQIRRSWRFQD